MNGAMAGYLIDFGADEGVDEEGHDEVGGGGGLSVRGELEAYRNFSLHPPADIHRKHNNAHIYTPDM